MKTHRTNSEAETRALAALFARTLQGGELIELEGELGSGKTTFVRGVAEALGTKVRVKSPTFTVANEYPVSAGAIKRIVHLDLYRLTDVSELQGLALSDYQQPGTVMFIEWPNIFGTSPFTESRKVKFTFIDETTREIEL